MKHCYQTSYLTDGFFFQECVGIFHSAIMQCKKRPSMFHTFLLNPLCQTLLLKNYQVTSSRTHETSHDQCTCTAAARSKQTSAGSAASKETSRRCASGGCSWCTYWHHHEISGDIKSQYCHTVREKESWIEPLLSQSQL